MYKELDVHKKRVNRMKKKIVSSEMENLNTRRKTNEQMADSIVKIISEEAGKDY